LSLSIVKFAPDGIERTLVYLRALFEELNVVFTMLFPVLDPSTARYELPQYELTSVNVLFEKILLLEPDKTLSTLKKTNGTVIRLDKKLLLELDWSRTPSA
jgi:hypothetical protein